MSRNKDWNLILKEDHDNFTTKIDAVDSSTTYIGKAAFGSATASAVWQIKKIATVSTVTTISFATGDDSFNQVWDNRSSLSYS